MDSTTYNIILITAYIVLFASIVGIFVILITGYRKMKKLHKKASSDDVAERYKRIYKYKPLIKIGKYKGF